MTAVVDSSSTEEQHKDLSEKVRANKDKVAKDGTVPTPAGTESCSACSGTGVGQ